MIDITLLACAGEVGRIARKNFAYCYGERDFWRFTKMSVRRQRLWTATGHVFMLERNWEGQLFVAHRQ